MTNLTEEHPQPAVRAAALEVTTGNLALVREAAARAAAEHAEAGAQEELYLGNDDDWLYGLHAMKPERGSA